MFIEIPNFGDLEGKTGGEIKLLTPGWYRVRIDSADIRTRQQVEPGEAATKYIAWQLRVVAPGEDFDGTPLWMNMSLKDTDAFERVKAFVLACGADFSDDGFSTEACIGKELEVNVNHREYQGEPRNNVRSFRAL